MAELRCYAIIGDSNVKRNLTPTTMHGRPAMSNAKVVLCGRMSTLSTALSSLPVDVDACVLACLSNLLTSIPGQQSSSVAVKARPVITSFVEKIVDFAKERTLAQVFLCPPMYRTTPLWYRDGLPENSQHPAFRCQERAREASEPLDDAKFFRVQVGG